ncbi:MAG: hypothetical protein QF913_08920, partial [Nitrospinaceae bacterium]|nr:hypothetical protein [Nitrospinaceae bacterium]
WFLARKPMTNHVTSCIAVLHMTGAMFVETKEGARSVLIINYARKACPGCLKRNRNRLKRHQRLTTREKGRVAKKEVLLRNQLNKNFLCPGNVS